MNQVMHEMSTVGVVPVVAVDNPPIAPEIRAALDVSNASVRGAKAPLFAIGLVATGRQSND